MKVTVSSVISRGALIDGPVLGDPGPNRTGLRMFEPYKMKAGFRDESN